MAENTTQKYDIVIIGSGVSGALIAFRMAETYKKNNKERGKILILEAGSGEYEADKSDRERLAMVDTYIKAAMKTPGSPYAFKGNMAPSPDNVNDKCDFYDQSKLHDNNQFKSTYQRRVGGTTWHWLGNCPRLLPNDFKSGTLYGIGPDWPISYDDLEPWYSQAEQELGVSGDHDELDGLFGAYRSRPFPMNRIWPSYSDLQIKKVLPTADNSHLAYNDLPLVLLNTPQARNSQPYQNRPVCTGNSSCVPICPVGAKYDATVHVRKAADLGVEIRSKAIVNKLYTDSATGRITKLSYLTWEKEEKTIEADLFVMAANAIETPRLLLLSDLAKGSKQVGRNLMDHPQGEGVIFSSEPLFPFRGPPTTSGIDKFRDGAFRKDFCAFRLSMGNDGGGRTTTPQAVLDDIITTSFGSTMRTELRNKVIRQFRISFLAEMKPLQSNTVTLSDTLFDPVGIPRPKINFHVDDYTMNGFNKVSEVMRSILQTLHPIGDMILPNNTSEHKGAGHIMGTCRMGLTAADSVVDRDCRAHEHSNLFLAGSSVFPTGGTANPTLTIAALSLRIADTIRQELKLN